MCREEVSINLSSGCSCEAKSARSAIILDCFTNKNNYFTHICWILVTCMQCILVMIKSSKTFAKKGTHLLFPSELPS